MECSICLRDWDIGTCVPKSLPCGHSFCIECLEDLYGKYKTGIVCPIDCIDHKMVHSEYLSLPKNYSLLSLISGQSPIHSNKTVENFEQKEVNPLEIINNQINHNPYCKKHQMLLHSYIADTNQLLCDKCLIELPKTVTSINPIPKVH